MEQLFPIEKFPEIHTEISGFFFLNGKRPMMSKLQRDLDPWPSLWRWFTNWAVKTCWGCIGNCDFIWTSESESNAFFTARITSSFDHNPSFGFLFRSYPHVKVTFVTQLRSIDRQESGLCCFSFARYFQKCVTQIYRALYGDAMFVSFWGVQAWRP